MAPINGDSLTDDNGPITASPTDAATAQRGSGSHSSSSSASNSADGGGENSEYPGNTNTNSNTNTNTNTNHGTASSRLGDLADEAAKKVDEFSALLADVESRTRNQRVLLERHYENMEYGEMGGTMTLQQEGAGGKRPTNLLIGLSNGQRTLPLMTSSHSLNKLKVDELMDFGPLSKKLKKNAVAADLSSPSHANTSVSSPANNINTRNPYTNSGIPSGRRFSTFAASLPRSTQQQQQYGRKSSVQLTSSPSVSHYSRLHSDTALTTTTPSFLPLSVSVSTGGDSSSSPPGHPSGKVNGESSLSPSSTPQQQQTVGGLVKLFSESAVIQGSNALDNVSDKDSAGRKKPIPPPLRPLTDSNSARLLVRGPEKVVFCSDPISPLANGPPLSPRVTSPVPNNPYLSVNDAANGKRSPSPSFSNSFFFGRNGGNGGGNSCERAVPETRPMSPLVGIHSLGEREQATKRSGSPSGSASSFPNPFAFARKLSGAFVSSDSSDGTVGKERSKGAKGDQQRALSPPAAMAPVLTNGKSDGTAVSPYAILKKPSEQLVIKQKQTVFQRRGSANPSGSSSSKTTLTKTVSHSNNNNSNGQPTANLPNVVYRSTSHLTLPTTEHRSIGSPISPPKTDTTPDSRSSSPSSFFGFSKSPKKDKQSSDNTNRPTDNSSSSGLERLLAGLNFSKFRITTGNTTPAAADKSGMGPSSNSQAPQTTTAVMPARGGAVPQLGQQLPQQQSKHEPNERLNRLGREVQTQASSSQARSSFMTRTVSQPTGLSVNQQETATGLGPSASAAVVQLRRDRPRVTVSEDRINLSSVGGGGCGSGVSEAGASSERVSEDIATLITDIRQHFQLSRMGASVGAGGGGGGGGGKRNGGCDGLSQLHQSVANSSALTATVSVDDQGKNELSEGGAESTCPESNRDSDYVVSLVSDGDYSESTTGHDGNGEFDTESTSSSFIFSPATSSAGSASRAATAGALERDSQLISGAIQTGPTGTEMYPPEKTQPATVNAVSKKPIDGSLYATTTTTKTTVICAAAAGTPYSRASSVERSMTFPPSVGRKTSATILPQDSISDMKYNDSQSTTHDGPNTVTAGLDDDPEHRLSSASFPESAVSDSLTDSVYSTAGSTSLSSYIHHHCCSSSSDTASFLSDSSSYVRPTPLETGVVRVGKPRYHSDPMTVAVSGPLLTGSTTASTTNTTGTCTCITPQASSISEPIHLLPVAACGATAIAAATAAGGTAAQCPPAVVAETVSSSASALPGKTAVAGIIPHGLKEVVIRESGGQFFGIVSSDQQQQLDGRNGGAMPKIADAATALQQKDYRSDSFRRSEKRLPRGPFGARLEEDQLRREHQQQQQQRQLIQDLSFLHDSPASTPGIPELSPSLPIHIDTETVEKITKGRRQSAALPTGQPDSRLVSRQYTAVRSSPDLYRTSSVGGVASPLSPLGGLRVSGGGHDICRSVSDAQASSWKRIAEESIGGGSDSAVYSGSSDSVVPTESSGGSSSGGGSHISSKGVTDFRTHIVRELYDTENSYVESLQILEKYYSTLQRNEDLVEKTLSENMFYQIPSIKLHHETLLMQLKHRIEHWDTRPKIGDLIVDTFTKEAVIDTYTAFINNWKTAKEAIKLAKTTRPCFVRCLEEWTREHRGKLNLDALLIMPVQRIPRYELLIKELLKHTPEDHPDRVDLESAQSELHDLALKINAMEHEVDEAERMMIRLKELEMYIDGLSDLVEPNRKFVKFDMVTMSSGMGMKKDRCLFLFSDLLIITNLKRKSGTIRKPSTHSCSPQLYPTLETNKYKLLMRVSLEDLELAKPVLLVPKKPFTNERELLECDLGVLSKISDLTGNLSASHQPLDDALRNMMAQVSRQLSERQAHANDPALSKVELTVATQNGLETVSVTFLSPNKRNTWERAFLEAKQALSLSADRRPPPDFLNPIPIRKTRAGLQLTCVATTSDLNVHDLKDVWVCNSDGYVGQVCVLSMQPEPALTSCVAVSNCKITCIASVPTSATMHKGGALLNSGNISPISDHSSSGDTNNDPLSSCITMELNSDDSSDEDNSLDEHSRSCPSDKETFPMSLSEDEMLAATKAHHIPDPTQGTMWIGMEDGRIFVYYCNDNIRIKKPRIKVQLPSAVHCITSTEHSVLVGLGNGQVAAFHRPAQGFWETLHPSYVDLGPSAAPVQRMIVVCGRLWCACLNMIHVINLSTLKIETSFPVVTDPSRHVTDMVSSGLGVWVSVQNSVVLRLCNALTYDFIADLNLTPSVQKMLAGCDDILRQHKFACLRVTAMLTCKDLLWVGTSAGVIMTINAPHVVQGMGKLSSMPTVTGIWHGHTGQVRFLHCLEQNSTAAIPIPSTRRSIRRDHRRHSIASAATMNKMIVISGGDGYEDFRCTPAHPATPTAITATAVVDNSGRDDSTNHLLLWQC